MAKVSNPVYKQVKDDIVESILSGVVEPGEMILPQSYYAEKYNVSRKAVRMAIDALVEKQVLETVKGKGTFVKDIIVNMSGYKRFGQWGESVPLRQNALASNVIEIAQLSASLRIARYLSLQEGAQVVKIARVRFVGEIPLCVQYSYLPHARVEQIDFSAMHLEKNSLYQVVATHANMVAAYSNEWLRAILCPQQVAALLDLPENQPVMYIKRQALEGDDIPMEYCEIYQRCDINSIRVGTCGI